MVLQASCYELRRGEGHNMTGHACSRVLFFLLVLILVITPATLSQCLDKCHCFATDKYQNMNCENRGFKEIDRRGSNLHANINYADNKLKKIADDAFTMYTRMEILNLSHNAIHEVGPNTFRGAPYLRQLDLSYNLLQLSSKYMHPNFLHTIEDLSLEGNERIGHDLDQIQPADDGNQTNWLVSTHLRKLNLAKCELYRFPSWMIRGLTSLDSINLSGNKLKVLPVPTLVSVCRLTHLFLSNNSWNCNDCNNLRSKTYLEDTKNGITVGKDFKFCPSLSQLPNCDTALVYDEENAKNLCITKPVPEKIVYSEPWSFWHIIAFVAGSIVALVLLAIVCNSVFSAICKKRRTVTQSPKSSEGYNNGDHELLQVLPR